MDAREVAVAGGQDNAKVEAPRLAFRDLALDESLETACAVVRVRRQPVADVDDDRQGGHSIGRREGHGAFHDVVDSLCNVVIQVTGLLVGRHPCWQLNADDRPVANRWARVEAAGEIHDMRAVCGAPGGGLVGDIRTDQHLGVLDQMGLAVDEVLVDNAGGRADWPADCRSAGDSTRSRKGPSGCPRAGRGSAAAPGARPAATNARPAIRSCRRRSGGTVRWQRRCRHR